MIRILTVIAFVIAASNVLAAQSVCNRFQAAPDGCDLNATAVEQAKCLLRPVGKFANLGVPLQELPAPLVTLVGQPTATSVTKEKLKRFLDAKGIREVRKDFLRPCVSLLCDLCENLYLTHGKSSHDDKNRI